MKRFSYLIILLSLSLASCANERTHSDYSLSWMRDSARLTVIGEDGKKLNVFDGTYLALPGYAFNAGQIALHPGRIRIGRICKIQQDQIYVTDVAPSVVFDFEAGKSYELRCENGSPKIILIESHLTR